MSARQIEEIEAETRYFRRQKKFITKCERILYPTAYEGRMMTLWRSIKTLLHLP